MTRKRTLISTLLTGILLAGFPLMAIARHNYIQEKDVKFKVQTSITPRVNVENFDIWSDINRLDLDEMTGGDSFLRGQTVYVHMSKGPEQIAYPFAVTADMPVSKEIDVFAIKGKVTGRQDNMLLVRYNFETFLPAENLREAVYTHPNAASSAILAINDDGIARLVSVEMDGITYPYRRIDGFTLNGLTQK